MKRYIAALLLACCVEGYAQEKKQAAFVPPFDFPLTLSGNFGEIRSNHFHGGLDFKTGGTIGKPVRALADGYISRIRVTNGSGYVLDVCYHNGYSTINRHLSAFLSPIAERVKKLQYENENWEVEIIPEPDEISGESRTADCVEWEYRILIRTASSSGCVRDGDGRLYRPYAFL